MAQLKPAIIAALKADAGVSAIVGLRVTPNFASRTEVYPRVVVKIPTNERGHILDGHTSQRIAHVQFFCQASRDLEADDLARAVDAAAEVFKVTITDPVVKTSQQVDETDDFELTGDGSDSSVFTRLVEYRVDYRL